MLRVIVATVFSRGPETQQVREQVRPFIKENRSNIIGVFKRQAKIVPTGDTAEDAAVLDELLKSYSALMAVVDYDQVQYP